MAEPTSFVNEATRGFADVASLRTCPCSRLRQAKPGSSFAMAGPQTGERTALPRLATDATPT